MPSGDAEASGKHESFASSTAVATVLPADGEIELRLVLRTGGSLRVNVTDARGVGVAAEFVVNGPLGAGENAEKHKDTSSADGIGTMGQLPPGNYEAVLQQNACSVEANFHLNRWQAIGAKSPEALYKLSAETGEAPDIRWLTLLVSTQAAKNDIGALRRLAQLHREAGNSDRAEFFERELRVLTC